MTYTKHMVTLERDELEEMEKKIAKTDNSEDRAMLDKAEKALYEFAVLMQTFYQGNDVRKALIDAFDQQGLRIVSTHIDNESKLKITLKD